MINLNKDIINKVIEIKQRKKIKLPDAIILSTAINFELDLVTANIDDFINIDQKLNIINPLA